MADEAYRKAIQLLARRAHFAREIERKLRDRGFSLEICRATVDRLLKERLLDDREAARGFVVARLRRGPVGRRRMRAELERRGASEDAVTAALAEDMPAEEGAAARRAAERWLGRRRPDRDALMRHLDRLGFSPRDIVATVEELVSAPGSGGARD